MLIFPVLVRFRFSKYWETRLRFGFGSQISKNSVSVTVSDSQKLPVNRNFGFGLVTRPFPSAKEIIFLIMSFCILASNPEDKL